MTAKMRLARALRLATALATALAAHAAFAQTSPAARLSEALRTLAQNPQSVAALIAAGEASLRVDDTASAMGFFRRAEALDPGNPVVKAGLGAVMARQRQPLEALRLFAEAEQGGGLALGYLGERGLAYDLIGDNARAQRDYANALAAGPDAVTSRRLALSQAIGGNQQASEATLLPLLQGRDLAAYRTRAFALAILGKGDEAVSIAETMLPADLSNRMAPYLRYMPRLTRAQQAAAADLGAFPSAGDIGRDDPQIAAYAASIGTPPPVRTADSRLVPSGAPLGESSSVRRREPAATPAPPPQVAVARPPAPAPTPGPAVRAATAPPVLPERARAMLEQHREPPPAPTSAARVAVATPAPAPTPTPAPPAVAVVPPARTPPAAQGPELARVTQEQAAAAPVVVMRQEPAPPPATPPAASPAPQLGAEAPPPATTPAAPVPGFASLSDAFADLRGTAPAASAAAPSGAVDITRIQPRRPPPPRPTAPPKPPPVPSRQWVQVATGRSTSALAFDWRRIKKEGGALLARQSPSTAKWGQTNRLLIGPFATDDAADAMVKKLKDKKLDAFRFTSDVGEEVKPLPGS